MNLRVQNAGFERLAFCPEHLVVTAFRGQEVMQRVPHIYAAQIVKQTGLARTELETRNRIHLKWRFSNDLVIVPFCIVVTCRWWTAPQPQNNVESRFILDVVVGDSVVR